jgi:hypothetical protein
VKLEEEKEEELGDKEEEEVVEERSLRKIWSGVRVRTRLRHHLESPEGRQYSHF